MIIVRAGEQRDAVEWAELYHGFRVFHHLPRDERIVDRVWEWVMDCSHPSRLIVAELDGQIVGFAQFRLSPRTILGDLLMNLDDLYTSPIVRGRGVASALFSELERVARENGAGEIQWVTNPWNEVARSYYRRISEETDWVTYRQVLVTDPVEGQAGVGEAASNQGLGGPETKRRLG
ncbi:GNAT family N-acetyltransferase [Agromyces sp. NPDC058484]|uniref:GNAT family N-acetyltransferase n=1 Tax=Agromyces sp. NPDC058484 TaxID=3346524 RepID=UPI003667B2CF